MCHGASTQERFYALHKNLKRQKQTNSSRICLALQEGQNISAQPAAPAPAPAAAAAGPSSAVGPGEVEGDSKAETPKKMQAAISQMAKKVKVKVGLSPKSAKHLKKKRLVVMLKKM
ncbi:hypothetical protein D9C73_003469 [Collichthys lucidus]|uniref:Uncharacterized protein n=1 Tax=Collichthys lucidus TaxID=240159 RepID=A0A4U5U8Q6_COLLU|nr:hypothetical protein D9C73_003469 [Collichthys lucidus]